MNKSKLREITALVRRTRPLNVYLDAPEYEVSLLVEHPFRGDRTPSFSLYRGSKDGAMMWKDHSTGESGDIVNLHMRIYDCTLADALKFLGNWDGETPVHPVRVISTSKQKRGARPNGAYIPTYKDPAKSNYLRETKLPLPGWVKEQLQVHTDSKHNLVYKTEGGWMVKGAMLESGRRWSHVHGNGNISVCGNPAADTTVVCEGFGDFLALLDLWNYQEHQAMYVIMNTTGNINILLDWLKFHNPKKLVLMMDKDKAGNTATVRIQGEFPNAIDNRSVITTGKDLRNLWDSQRVA